MNATEVLSELKRQHILVSVDGGNLNLVPLEDNVIPSDLLEKIKANKQYIIDSLSGNTHNEPPPLVPEKRDKEIPLSFAQQRLWFIDQFEQNDTSYNLPWGFRLAGKLDVPALHKALQTIIDRHESLRTTFHTVEGRAVQVIADSLTLDFPVIDITEDQVPAHAKDFAAHQFNLATGPLIKMCLLRLGAEAHILLANMHHIVFDGWSGNVLLKEMAALYRAYTQGEPSPLPPLPIQYADFAAWQRGWLRGEAMEQHIGYWERQLDGAPPLSSFPTDFARPAKQNAQGSVQRLHIPKELTDQLNALARRERVTLFMLLMAALQVLLARYSGQTDVCVGTPVANRKHPALSELIGFFVNTLVIRTQVDGNLSFKELLRQVKATALAAYRHQDLPFDQLIEALNPERSMSYSPLFQVALALQNAGNETLALGDLSASPVAIDIQASPFDLSLDLTETDQGLTGMVFYRTSLFTADTVQRILAHFQTLLAGIVQSSDKALSTIPLLNEQERHTLLYTWNQTDAPYPHDKTLHQLFEEQVEKTPSNIALVFEGEELTYQALNQRANQLAHWVRERYQQRNQRPMPPDTLIGLYLDRGPEMVISILATLKAGGAYVPISPEYPKERTLFMLEDTQTPVLLTQRRFMEALDEWLPELPHTPDLLAADDVDLIEDLPTTNPKPTSKPTDLAYVIYTSGTTGKPKGVLTPHRGVVSLIINNDYIKLSSKDVLLHLSNPNFDATTFEVWGALLNGAKLVVANNERGNSIDQIGSLLRDNGITVLFVTRALFDNLYVQQPNLFNSLRYLLTGGEALTPDLVRKLVAQGKRPKHLLNCYGPTESTTFTTTYECALFSGSVPLGKPINTRKLYVLDPFGNPCPIGVPGELYIGGAGLARGYLNRPELTQERFVNNPFATKADKQKGYNRLYKTGDIVRWLPYGNIEYLGRNDFQVKIRGFRIELGEIESALAGLPDIKQVVVIDRERDGNKYLAAYLVTEAGVSINEEQLRESLASSLPEYMVPSTFSFIDTLPLTINGKLDRRALPEPEFVSGDNYVAPRNDTEAKLCAIWQSVLGLEKVGIHDNFFRIGGNSITAVKLTFASRRELGADIPLALLFEQKTIAGLATRLNQQDMVIIPKSTLRQPPLSFAQERLLFIERFEQGTNAYHIPYIYQLHSDADLAVLEAALRILADRHPVLKTAYLSDDNGNDYQCVLDVEIPLQRQVLDNYSEFLTAVKTNISRPFDLTTEPSIRLHYYQVEGTQYLLLLVHHIAFDGWSTDIFLQELGEVYTALHQGKQVNLPALDISYVDYAVWQRNYLQGDTLENLLSYWRQQLSGYETLTLPTDYPRPKQLDYQGKNYGFILNEPLSQQLRDLAKAHNTTLYTILLSAFYVTLAKYSGQTDIVVGTPSDNRHHAQTQNLVGFFVNSLALRAQVEPTITIEKLVARVHQIATQAKVHQELPFERLIDALNVERDTSRHPIFQTMFSVQSFGEKQSQYTNLPFSPVAIESEQDIYSPAKFDLSLFLSDKQTEIAGGFNFATSLFAEDTIARMAAIYQRVLKAFANDQRQPIAQIDVLSEEERHTLLYTWNQTDAPYPQDKTLHQLFEEQVTKTPDNIALIFENKELTYQVLNQRANQLAHVIRERYQQRNQAPMPPDTLIGLYMDRSPEMVISILATLKAGGAYIPILPEYPKERTLFILADTQAPILLTQQSFVETLDQWFIALNNAPDLLATDDIRLVKDRSAINLEPVSSSTDLVYILYTSGTTGKPKGVMVEHQAIVNYCDYATHNYYDDDLNGALLLTSYAFDLTAPTIYLPLLSGDHVHIVREGQEFDDLVKIFSKREMNYLLRITPSHISSLLALLEGHGPYFGKHTFVIGGEPLSTKMLESLKSFLPDAQCYNHYGPTEAIIGCALYSIPEQIQVVKNRSLPIGQPMSNTRLYVLNALRQPQPIGCPGELYIGGVLARSYLNRPDLTKKHFIDNTFATKVDKKKGYDRLYKTGDVVRWLPDGNLEYLGRNDFQVKIRGFRIELGEIESALTNLPDVKQAVVIDRERDGNKYLAAYLVVEADISIDEEQLREHLDTKLPQYMVPSTFTFIDAIPLTINGKLDRRALPEPEFVCGDTYVAPRNELEQQLCLVWQEVLGLEKIGIQDNFFYMGGNSVIGTKMIGKVNKIFDKNIPISTLFIYPKIYSFAEAMKDENSLNDCLKTLADSSDSKNLLFMIHPGSGGCEAYCSLATELANNFDCIGIDNYNFYSKRKITSLSEISEIYLTQILNKYPTLQKFNFLGWSLGGLIAMEVCYKLENMGITDNHIYLLDTIISNSELKKLRRQMHTGEKGKEILESELIKRRYDREYIKKCLSVMEIERGISESSLSGLLRHTKVTLFKAGKGVSLIDKDIEERCNQISMNLADNNLTPYVNNKISIILCKNRSHSDIVDEVEVIKNVLIKDHVSAHG